MSSLAAVATGSFALVSPAQAAGFDDPGAAVSGGKVQTAKAPKVDVAKTEVPAVTETKKSDDGGELVAEIGETDIDSYRLVGVTWSPESTATDVHVQIKTRTDGEWSKWQELDYHGEEGVESAGIPGTEPLWVDQADGVAARVESHDGTVKGVEISTIDPGSDPKSTAQGAVSDGEVADGVARATTAAYPEGQPTGMPAFPAYKSRAAWGASAPKSCDSPNVGSTTTGAVIHHTAGSNSYSASSSASLVRGVQAFHMKSRGWCDIGYNFLVDKYGMVFEGRAGGIDRAVRAAHAGNTAVNTLTMGVSMMGNFESTEPSDAMKTAVVRLVGNRFARFYLPATGTYSIGGKTLHRIAGHRNVVGTACPGARAYAWLSANGGLRDRVASYIAKTNSPNKARAKQIGAGAVWIAEWEVGPAMWTRYRDKELWSTAAAGSHILSGTFQTAHHALGNGRFNTIGYPTTDSPSVGSSLAVQRFTGGAMYVTPSRKAYSIWGAGNRMYDKLSGPSGQLGAPTSSVAATENHERTNFERGYILANISEDTAVAYDSNGKKVGEIGPAPPVPTAPPAVPSGVKVTPTANSATVSWNKANDADRYDVCLFETETPTTCTHLRQTTGNSVNFTGLSPTSGTDWYVRITAFNSLGRVHSPLKGFDLDATAPTKPPAAPTGVKVAPTANSATVTWDAASDAQRYDVCLFETETPTTCTHLRQTTGNSVNFTGLSPTSGTDWYVRITAFNSAGRVHSALKGFDLDATAPTKPPAAPTGVKVTSTSNSASISWTKGADADRYDICLFESTTATSCGHWGQTTGSSINFSGLKATSGTDWYVRITAFNSAGRIHSSLTGFDLKAAPPTSPPAAPAGIKITPTSNSAAISWNAADDADRYDVCLFSSGTSATCEHLRQTTGNSVSFNGLPTTGGTDWYARITAFNAAGRIHSARIPFDLSSGSANPSGANSITVPSSRNITFKGHGYGHGIGMSQYGAEGAARQGKKYNEILAHYYRGTSLSSTSGNLRVLISADDTDGVLFNAESGLYFTDVSTGRRVALPTSFGGKRIDRYEMKATSSGSSKSKMIFRFAGGAYQDYKHGASTLTWSGDGQVHRSGTTVSLVLPSGSTMKLRGVLRSVKPSSGSGARDTLNVLGVDDYVRGVIAAEMPSSWHSEALKAQAVAARTYGIRSRNTSRYYDICSTTACQVYGGASREASSTNAAVSATSNKVLTYNGSPALTQFSSSSGGYTAAGSAAYLQAISDPWDGWSGNPNHNWSQAVKASTIESKYGVGTLNKLVVTKRTGGGDMGGRVTSLQLVGSKKTVTISGTDARWAFGLKSHWFGF